MDTSSRSPSSIPTIKLLKKPRSSNKLPEQLSEITSTVVVEDTRLAVDGARQKVVQHALPAVLGVADPKHAGILLVTCGSFNPITLMHLRMFDIAVEELQKHGYHVLGCYMSPVADAYGKPGLAAAEHRVEMCRCACDSHPLIMLDVWEAEQPTYTRTLAVLKHVKERLAAHFNPSPGADRPTMDAVPQEGSSPPRIMLLCGGDVFATILTPGVWKSPDTLLKEHGCVVIQRPGTDLGPLVQPCSGAAAGGIHDSESSGPSLVALDLSSVEFLGGGTALVVKGHHLETEMSSTQARLAVAAGDLAQAAKILPAPVLDYVVQHGLYK